MLAHWSSETTHTVIFLSNLAADMEELLIVYSQIVICVVSKLCPRTNPSTSLFVYTALNDPGSLSSVHSTTVVQNTVDLSEIPIV